MTDTALKADLDQAIEQVVRAEFSDAVIEAVHVLPDFYEDGDCILRVMVEFKAKSKFDAKKAKGLTRHMFPALNNLYADAFPIVSFRSKANHARVASVSVAA